MKIRKYYIPQIDETDCGVAALATIFKYYGSTYSIAYLRHLAQTNLEGTTALGLIKAAQKLNFDTKAIKADMSLFKIKHLSTVPILELCTNLTRELV